MRIEFERFLTITALLAGAMAPAVGCTVVSDDSDNEGGAPGVSGGGGRGGTAGSAGTAGQAGTSGQAGSAGKGGTAGQDGGTVGSGGSPGDASACLGDTLSADWDAGSAPCEILPYKTCTGGATPLAYDICTYMDDGTSRTRARKGIAGGVARCFAQITGGDACDDAWVQPKAESCLAEVFPRACGQLGPIPLGNGDTRTCQELVDTCTVDGGTANLTVADCELSLNAFQPWAQTEIANCFLDIADSGDCKADFDYCVFPP